MWKASWSCPRRLAGTAGAWVASCELLRSCGWAGLIATINHCGEEANTHSGPRWKCSSSCEDGWEGVGFDDSGWPVASNLGING